MKDAYESNKAERITSTQLIVVNFIFIPTFVKKKYETLLINTWKN